MNRAVRIIIGALVLLGAACAAQEAEGGGPPLTAVGRASDTTVPTTFTGSGNTEHPPPDDVQLGECLNDNLFGPKATGTLTNQSSKLSNYMISVNFVDEAGVIVAQGTALATNIPAGASATWEALSFSTDARAANCSVVKVDRFSAQG